MVQIREKGRTGTRHEIQLCTHNHCLNLTDAQFSMLLASNPAVRSNAGQSQVSGKDM